MIASYPFMELCGGGLTGKGAVLIAFERQEGVC